MPGGIDIMGMRTSIDIDNRRIGLRGIEISRFHHSVKKICNAIGGLDASAFEDWLLVAFPRIISLEQFTLLSVCGIYDVDDTRNLRGSKTFVGLLAGC